MKLYDIFKSEGGFRFAGALWVGNPIISSCPWFAKKEDAVNAARMKKIEAHDNWANEEMERLGIN